MYIYIYIKYHRYQIISIPATFPLNKYHLITPLLPRNHPLPACFFGFTGTSGTSGTWSSGGVATTVLRSMYDVDGRCESWCLFLFHVFQSWICFLGIFDFWPSRIYSTRFCLGEKFRWSKTSVYWIYMYIYIIKAEVTCLFFPHSSFNRQETTQQTNQLLHHSLAMQCVLKYPAWRNPLAQVRPIKMDNKWKNLDGHELSAQFPCFASQHFPTCYSCKVLAIISSHGWKDLLMKLQGLGSMVTVIQSCFFGTPCPPPHSKTLRHCGSYFLENGVASSRGDRHERYRVDIDIDDYSNTTKITIYHANQEIQQQIAAHNNQFLQKQKTC